MDHEAVPMKKASWNVIKTDMLIDMMKRAAAGEDPDMIYAEFYANCDHEQVEGKGSGAEQ